jgi:hypothetical protein
MGVFLDAASRSLASLGTACGQQCRHYHRRRLPVRRQRCPERRLQMLG